MPNDGATTGKPFSFNLVGDALHLYNTARAHMEGAVEADEQRVKDELAKLPAEVRALVQARMSPVKAENISHKQVFTNALAAYVAKAEADSDAEEAAPEPAPETPADTPEVAA